MYRQYDKNTTEQSKGLVKKHQNKITLGIIFGAIGAVLIGGFLLSGGTTPNGNIGSVFNPLPVYNSGLGAVNGHVSGPLGLPAVGATVVMSQQMGSYKTVTSFISVDGQFVLPNLEPGRYNFVVAFPDGTNRVLNNIVVGPGSVQTLDIKY
jgi:hypothetical protein